MPMTRDDRALRRVRRLLRKFDAACPACYDLLARDVAAALPQALPPGLANTVAAGLSPADPAWLDFLRAVVAAADGVLAAWRVCCPACRREGALIGLAFYTGDIAAWRAFLTAMAWAAAELAAEQRREGRGHA